MIDAFISYSTRNSIFVQSLADELSKAGKKVWFDQKRDPLEGIPRGTRWWEEIQQGISNAANLLFIISPESMVSPYCNAELAYALKEEKRIVTVLYCEGSSPRDTLETINTAIDAIDSTQNVPEVISADISNLRSLTRRNWLEISQIQFVVAHSSDAVDHIVQQVADAIDLDIQWLRLWNDFRQAVQLWAESGKDDDFLWGQKRLARIREAASARGQGFDDLQQEFALPETQRLLLELDNIDTPHARRSEISLRLHTLGDPRPGIGVVDGVPDIVWCAIPAGQVAIEGKTFQVAPFYMAKYLITYPQFQAFLDSEDGFENDTWWQGLHQDGIKQPMKEQRQRYSNYPRDSVSWYQAMAFTRWLNHRLHGYAFHPENAPFHSIGINNGVEVRLPMEWEWQHAATSGNPRNKYPWGDWDGRLANTSESGIGRSTAVGMYPAGRTEMGLLDMAGNLWEWCLNDFQSLGVKINTIHRKTVRGGSWFNSQDTAACAVRSLNDPANRLVRDGRNDDRGFRVVVVRVSAP